MTSLVRKLAAACLGAGLLASTLAASAADAWPTRPIRIVVGYSAGGAVDLIARSVGQQLSTQLGQPVLIENKPGAGTNIAVKSVTTSAPDGYTLMLAANALAVNPTLFKPAPYDLAKDITPVSLVGRVPVVFATREDGELKSLAQLVAAARAKPNAISLGTPGNGSTPHLAMELFTHTAGIQLRHVPYKGGSQALTDTIGGHTEIVAVNALEAAPLAKAGKLRVLAVMSPERSGVLPNVPTVAESGYPGFEASVWYGFIGPAGLPQPIVAKLHEAVQKAIESREVREQLAAAGGLPLPGPTAQFDTLLKSEATRYGQLIREAGIQPD